MDDFSSTLEILRHRGARRESGKFPLQNLYSMVPWEAHTDPVLWEGESDGEKGEMRGREGG